jgi:hypothetical protein
MVRAKGLNELEKREVGYKSEQRLQHFSFNPSSQKDDNKISTGKVFSIAGVVSAIIIASIVIVRKKSNNKSKE